MRILLVEDEHKIAQSIKKGLMQEHFAVDVAFDGETGLDLALTEDYDVMLLDRLLPHMDGVEICKKVRASNIHTPILMLTAKGEISDRVEGLNSGADDYLVKPFAFEELLARIRALVRRPRDVENTILRVGNLTLDTNNYEVRRKDRNISLSSKEFALLEYLMRNANKIVTKEQIIAHVWDYDSDVLPNNVEVYVGYLRNKIGKPDLIQTVRGFGYKMGLPAQTGAKNV